MSLSFSEYTNVPNVFFNNLLPLLLVRRLLSAPGVEYGVFENGVEDKAPSVLLKYFHRRLHSKRPMDVYRPDVSQSGVRVAISHISVSRAIAFAAFM